VLWGEVVDLGATPLAIRGSSSHSPVRNHPPGPCVSVRALAPPERRRKKKKIGKKNRPRVDFPIFQRAGPSPGSPATCKTGRARGAAGARCSLLMCFWSVTCRLACRFVDGVHRRDIAHVHQNTLAAQHVRQPPSRRPSRIVCTFFRHCSVLLLDLSAIAAPVAGVGAAPWPDNEDHFLESHPMPANTARTGFGKFVRGGAEWTGYCATDAYVINPLPFSTADWGSRTTRLHDPHTSSRCQAGVLEKRSRL